MDSRDNYYQPSTDRSVLPRVVIIVLFTLALIMFLIWRVVRYMTSPAPAPAPPPPPGLGGGGGGAGDIELGGIRERLRVEDTRIIVFRSAADTPHIGDICPLCLSEYEVGEELCSLPPCTHTFHLSCTRELLVKYTLCPICRKIISLPYDEEESV